jgi:hypothetical protein
MSYSNCPSSSDTVNLADRVRDEVALVTQLGDTTLIIDILLRPLA